MKPQLSYSRASSFLGCKKRYYWIYFEGLVPKEKSVPLQVGDVVHQLFLKQYTGELTQEKIENLDEFVKELYPENTDETSYFVALQAATLFSGYLMEHADDPVTIVSSEIWLEAEMPTYFLKGRIDALGRMKDTKLWEVERKTTSYSDSAFLAGLKGSLQTGIYYILMDACLKEKVAGTLYDLLVKTKIPTYPRNPVLRNPRLIKRALETLEGVARDLKEAMERGPEAFYPSCNCFSYNRECEYKCLCDFDSEEVRKSFFNTIPVEERR